MSLQLNAIVIDSDANSRHRITDLLRMADGALCLLAAAESLADGINGVLPTAAPQIIVLEVRDLELGVKEVEFLSSRYPHCAIFVSCAHRNTEWILGLFRAGAREYLNRPVHPAELIDAVKKVVRGHAAKSGTQLKRGEVISVYNPSGGMGVTTISVNLAAALAAQGKKTALVDLNLFSGDVTAFLDLAPRYSLASMLPKAGQIDSSFVETVIAPHPSGIHVLDSPASLGESQRIHPELVEEVVGVLSTVFDRIVIDCGGPLYGCSLTAFDRSDHLLYGTVLSLPALRNGKRYLAALDAEGFGPERVKVVVNRHNPKDDIRPADAEKVLGVKAYHTLPNCYAEVKSSMFKGVPLVLSHPKSPLAKGVEQLASRLDEGQTQMRRTAGL